MRISSTSTQFFNTALLSTALAYGSTATSAYAQDNANLTQPKNIPTLTTGNIPCVNPEDKSILVNNPNFKHCDPALYEALKAHNEKIYEEIYITDNIPWYKAVPPVIPGALGLGAISLVVGGGIAALSRKKEKTQNIQYIENFLSVMLTSLEEQFSQLKTLEEVDAFETRLKSFNQEGIESYLGESLFAERIVLTESEKKEYHKILKQTSAKVKALLKRTTQIQTSADLTFHFINETQKNIDLVKEASRASKLTDALNLIKTNENEESLKKTLINQGIQLVNEQQELLNLLSQGLINKRQFNELNQTIKDLLFEISQSLLLIQKIYSEVYKSMDYVNYTREINNLSSTLLELKRFYLLINNNQDRYEDIARTFAEIKATIIKQLIDIINIKLFSELNTISTDQNYLEKIKNFSSFFQDLDNIFTIFKYEIVEEAINLDHISVPSFGPLLSRYSPLENSEQQSIQQYYKKLKNTYLETLSYYQNQLNKVLQLSNNTDDPRKKMIAERIINPVLRTFEEKNINSLNSFEKITLVYFLNAKLQILYSQTLTDEIELQIQEILQKIKSLGALIFINHGNVNHGKIPLILFSDEKVQIKNFDKSTLTDQDFLAIPITGRWNHFGNANAPISNQLVFDSNNKISGYLYKSPLGSLQVVFFPKGLKLPRNFKSWSNEKILDFLVTNQILSTHSPYRERMQLFEQNSIAVKSTEGSQSTGADTQDDSSPQEQETEIFDFNKENKEFENIKQQLNTLDFDQIANALEDIPMILDRIESHILQGIFNDDTKRQIQELLERWRKLFNELRDKNILEKDFANEYIQRLEILKNILDIKKVHIRDSAHQKNKVFTQILGGLLRLIGL